MWKELCERGRKEAALIQNPRALLCTLFFQTFQHCRAPSPIQRTAQNMCALGDRGRHCDEAAASPVHTLTRFTFLDPCIPSLDQVRERASPQTFGLLLLLDLLARSWTLFRPLWFSAHSNNRASIWLSHWPLSPSSILLIRVTTMISYRLDSSPSASS